MLGWSIAREGKRNGTAEVVMERTPPFLRVSQNAVNKFFLV
jgi:hypothetical protein